MWVAYFFVRVGRRRPFERYFADFGGEAAMQRYDIVIDGELTADLVAPGLPMRRRNGDRATILSVPALDAGALGRTLQLLESLGIGVTAINKVEDADDHNSP
jgi:hypothetical protein